MKRIILFLFGLWTTDLVFNQSAHAFTGFALILYAAAYLFITVRDVQGLFSGK